MFELKHEEVSQLPAWARKVEERLKRMDRRREERQALGGTAMAVFADRGSAAKIAQVELVDSGATGVGVRSYVNVDKGSSFTLTPDNVLLPKVTGTVVRCIRDGEGYRLGLRLVSNAAVA